MELWKYGKYARLFSYKCMLWVEQVQPAPSTLHASHQPFVLSDRSISTVTSHTDGILCIYTKATYYI